VKEERGAMIRNEATVKLYTYIIQKSREEFEV
jgi:hypothetical protein